ncbi:beta strand repeat-containing protein [Aurantibacter sp.]|uniref:beta strand repeat-containing protein n=1 Tax=Aurantibacter sp. TaxID=2807103 RepID=UPI0035C8344B
MLETTNHLLKKGSLILFLFLGLLNSNAQTTFTFSHNVVGFDPFYTLSNDFWTPYYPGTTINAGDKVIINSNITFNDNILNNGEIEIVFGAKANYTKTFTNNGEIFIFSGELYANTDQSQSYTPAFYNSGEVTVLDALNHSTGTFINSGTIDTSGYGVAIGTTINSLTNLGLISGDGKITLNSLTNHGTIDTSGDLLINGTSEMLGPGVIENFVSLKFEDNFANYGTIKSNSLSGPNPGTTANYGTMSNYGTIISTNKSFINNYGTITNYGTINIEQYLTGELGNINNSGIISIEPNGVINNTGNIILTTTGSIANSGTITQSALGTFTSSGTLNIESDGIFTNSGNISIENEGSISNTGDLTTNTTGNITIKGILSVESGGELTNSGSINIVTSANLNNSGTTTLTETSVLSNSGTINNSATLSDSGSITQTSTGVLTNTGTTLVESTGSINNSGTISNTTGTINNVGTITLTGTGLLENTNYINNTGIIDNLGTFNIAAFGTVDNSRAIHTKGTTTNLGQINNTLNSFLFVFVGGVFNNGGIIDNLGNLWSAGSLINTNSITNANLITNNGSLQNGLDGTLINTVDGILENINLLSNFGNISNAGSIDNTGTLLGYNISHTGDFSNNDGVLQPSYFFFSTLFAGTYIFNDNYTHNNSKLKIHLESLTSFSNVEVANTANLSGVLDVYLYNYTPNIGDTFTILKAGNILGTFDTVNLPAGYNWDVIYTTTEVNLKITPVTLNPVVFLQGALLSSGSNLMRDDLRSSGYLPTTSPYADGATCLTSVFNTGGTNGTGLPEDDIVDWIWVELRDANDNTNVIAGRSALLQRDGDIVNLDGIKELTINAPVNNYYVSINHRNHLGIISNAVFSLSDQSTNIDFTDSGNPITFGTNAQTTFGMPNGVVAMWSGDANGDGRLNYIGVNSEIPHISSQVFNDPNNSLFGGPPIATYTSTGYSNTDVNMNGETIYIGANSEVQFISGNIFNNPSNSLFGGLPIATYQFLEQLP